MKNRKLFAIITLVAFMLTMMPMMAFAATASGSSISVEDGSAKVGEAAGLEFTLDIDEPLITADYREQVANAMNTAKSAVDAAWDKIQTYNGVAENVDITFEGEAYNNTATAGKGASDEGVALAKKYNDAIADYQAAVKLNTTVAASKNQILVIFAERNGSLSDADTITVNGQTGVGALVLEAIGARETPVKVTSNTAGTVTMKAYLVTDAVKGDGWNIAELYNGISGIIKTGLIGNGCTGTFKAQGSDPGIVDLTVNVANTTSGNKYAAVQNADDEYIGYKSGQNTVYTAANGGVDYYDVSFKAYEGSYDDDDDFIAETKLAGEDVTVTVNKNGATVNKEEITSSATGKVDFKVSADRAGTYIVTIEFGGDEFELVFVFGANDISRVEFASVANGVIAVDETETVAMSFNAYDANGRLLTGDLADEIAANFAVEVTSAPEDSSFEDEILDDFVYNINTTDKVYMSFKPDAVGTYTFKVYNKVTGASDVATIEADEFGKIDHLTISYPSAAYALGATTQTPTVKVVDTNGVKKNASNKQFSYTGLGVIDFNERTGKITFSTDSKYSGNEITVSVVGNQKYAATTTLTIGAEPAAIEFTAAQGEIGEDVTVNAQVVDINGNATAIANAADYEVEVQSAIIIEKPEGATASVDADALAEQKANLLKKGTGKVTITSNKEGTVKANVVLKLTANIDITKDGIEYKAEGAGKNPYVFYISGVATATFGDAAYNPETAGDVVTFIIGTNTFIANDKAISSDVAPYIVDGRTFIPVRAFVEATGASVEFDAATQVVTIAGEGIDAQMTIGSNILTVNGETVVMDTAAAIKDGRTVLPVRYAGQAIGYDFECAYGANGAVTAVTMFK